MWKAKMTLWSTLTDVNEILGVMVWLRDPAVYSLMKSISNAFTSQLSGQGDLTICMMFAYLKVVLFLQNIQNEMCIKLVHNSVKIVRNSAELNEERDAVCHFVYCFSVSSSIKAVAHLLIRADVPANHSDEGGKKINKRIQNSISKGAISSLLNEPQMMR